jgi:hypothetical protein
MRVVPFLACARPRPSGLRGLTLLALLFLMSLDLFGLPVFPRGRGVLSGPCLALDSPVEVQPQPSEPANLGPRQDILRKLGLGSGHGDTLGFGYYELVNGAPVAVEGEAWTWDHKGRDPLEGWTAVDHTANTRAWFGHLSATRWKGHGNPGDPPIPSGNGCVWLGAFQDHADSLCWKEGLGYGNNWCQVLISPPLAYNGNGPVTLRFKYFNDTEDPSDHTRVVLRIVGGRDVPLNEGGFRGRIGTPPGGPWGRFAREITRADFGGYLPRQFHIVVQFDSDEGSSDEDGGHATPFGPFGLDDVQLSGALTQGDVAYDFENGLQEWSVAYRHGSGALFAARPLGRYTIEDAGPCGLSGNVIGFHNDDDQHPDGQWVLAYSPPVDRSPYKGYENVFADWDMYGVMPANNGVFYRAGWSYWPYQCADAKEPGWSARVGDPTWQYTGGPPDCLHRRIHAASSGVPEDCRLVRLTFEVTSSCETFGIPDSVCTGLTNFTPVIDNVRILMTQVPMGKLAFEQLSFDNGDSLIVRDSKVGRVRYSFPPEEAGFLNLACRRPDQPRLAAWVVRNLALPAGQTGTPAEEISARFPLADLAVEPGQTLERLSYCLTITPSPLLDQEYHSWRGSNYWHSAVPVRQVTIDGLGAGGGTSCALAWPAEGIPDFGSYDAPVSTDPGIWIGQEMPNLDLDRGDRAADQNGALPAAFANVLHWLAGKQTTLDINSRLRETYSDLEHLLGRSPGEPAGDRNAIQAVLDYGEAYELPLRIRYQSGFLSGPILSSSGLSQAECVSPTTTPRIVLTRLFDAAVAGRGVVVISGGWYQDRDNLRRYGGTAAALAGISSVCQVTKLTLRYDDIQRDGHGPVQEQSEAFALPGGMIRLPGLDRVARPDAGGPPRPLLAFLETAVEVAYDEKVEPIEQEHTFAAYGEWFLRTLPPHHRLSVRFPDKPGHGYRTTVYQMRRDCSPSRLAKIRVWNGNAGTTRRIANNLDRCMTVAVQNEDWIPGRNRPDRYTVKLRMEEAGIDESSSSSNEEAGAGFIVGVMDGQSDEFDNVTAPAALYKDAVGGPLEGVPRLLGSAGVASLTLSHEIGAWNPYWNRLALHLGVANTRHPGTLLIECPQAGFRDHVTVDHAGVYLLDLGQVSPAAQISLILSADDALEFELDAIGLSSEVRPEGK